MGDLANKDKIRAKPGRKTHSMTMCLSNLMKTIGGSTLSKQCHSIGSVQSRKAITLEQD